ncbi:MAG: transglycosylase domain-containing protein [Rhodoplanes sp.]|uniref:penicillin-binding protein 1A n=1 Tax=Rhodoplanes sp. TaxID=1968906 RepID=UPI00183E0788|nr:transglycosylase domain-containing protein [Rhodoplanes sp.]NVO14917.1 transglycosylase domain-containing protein [Rhodoplanes sp.]
MDVILVKILAAFLALSQVAIRPETIRTEFDRTGDQAAVVQILRDGCAHMRKAFDIESIDIDGLISTALEDPQAFTGEIKAFKGLDFAALPPLYRQLCKNEDVTNSPADIGAVIDWYNKAVADLPDPRKLKGFRPSGTSTVLDAKGGRFAEVFEPDNRRVWVPLAEIPEHVQKAFVAAEDKRFYQHKGIDERGLIRAMVGNLARPGRPQGGSTITQQVVKNLLVGDDLTYERKVREMIVAARLEQTLTKPEILELYLNSIFLGRGSWGIELAARSWFGKPASALTLAEGAALAGLTKGPSYYSPDRHPERAQERLSYVLTRLQEDGTITPEQATAARAGGVKYAAYERLTRTSGFHVLDHIAREARSLPGVAPLTVASSTVRSTINPDLQKATEAALQEGLSRYEANTGRAQFFGPELNLAVAIQKLQAASGAPQAAPPAAAPQPVAQPGSAGRAAKSKAAPPVVAPAPPAAPWQEALKAARMPLYDVHWTPAVVIQKGSDTIKVGLADGRVLALSGATAPIRRTLALYDVVYVKASDGNKGARADLRIRPIVQGAALVLENKTGRILAMTGGFSYPLSQINRTTQTARQPGSAFKPFTYLAALHKGLQPNTLVRDEPITLPPVGNSASARDRDYWTPKNYEGGSSGILTLRLGLEYSKNLVTAQLLDGGISSDPTQSLGKVCELALEAQVYRDCVGYYPFVLGAQPVRLIDLAAFYAAIASEGMRPAPYAVESVEEQGKVVFRHTGESRALAGGDRVAFVQLRSMMQGVLARGTARAISSMSPYVAGKTGTSDDENDAWFVGFSNDVTIAVWVGYDNADGKRRTLGGGQTGGSVAVPIFTSIIDTVWGTAFKKVPLAPPSPQAQRQLIALPIDLRSGNRLSERVPGAFTEYFRLDRSGQLADTQYDMVSASEVATQAYRDPNDGELFGYGTGNYPYGSGTYGSGGVAQSPFQGFPFGYQTPHQQRQPPTYQGQSPYYGQGVRPPPQSPGGLFGQLGRPFGSDPRYRDPGREGYPAQRVDPQYPYAERDRYW